MKDVLLFINRVGGGCIKAAHFLPGKLDEHYDDHAEDFPGELTPDEYEDRARNFFDSMVIKDKLWNLKNALAAAGKRLRRESHTTTARFADGRMILFRITILIMWVGQTL
jgi:hypothetical protein